ncbi:MAG TPA: hypothetical protein VGL41_05725 [Roseiarcus sp.]
MASPRASSRSGALAASVRKSFSRTSAVWQDYQDGIFAGTDEVIGRVTGKAPMTLQEFIKAHIDVFRPAEAEEPPRRPPDPRQE